MVATHGRNSVFRPQRYLLSCLNGHSSRRNNVGFIFVVIVGAVTRSHTQM